MLITRARLHLPLGCGAPICPCEALSLAQNKATPLEMIMKVILSALVALSFLAGAVAPASADWYDGSLIQQLEKEGRGGHST
jgi:hypothetical protein